MEEPLFIPHEGSQLFGVLHAPVELRTARVGIVFCDAFAEEKLWAQRLQVNFARVLAGRGYWVLRFDCRGHGDSGGEFDESTVESRLSDIARAMAFLRERTQVRAVGLHGLRFGGTLAALVAARGEDVAFLALWNPIVQGAVYFQECLRSNLATQMATYRKVLRTREDLVRGLDDGQPVNIDGYLVSPEFYREASAIDLRRGLGSYAQPVYVAQVSRLDDAKPERDLSAFCEKLKSDHVPVDFQLVRGEPFWKETRWYIQSSEPLFSDAARWLGGIAGLGGAEDGTRGKFSQ